MSAMVVDGGQGALAVVQAQTQALELALKAAAVLKSARGLLPDALKNEGEIVAVLIAGQELGIPAMAALRSLQVVKGKIVISYDMMIALLRRAGYRIEWLTSTATEATLRLTAPDKTTHVETWTEARARKAGLWGQGTWGKYPDTMLRARCVSSAARAFAGEVLAGVYCEESGEGEEIAGPRVVEMRREERPAAGEVIDAEPVREAERPVPSRMADCETPEELRVWIATHWPTVLRERGPGAAARVVQHGERLGVDVAEVDTWLGAATPAEESAAAE